MGWTKVTGDDVGELHFSYYPATPVDDVDAHCGGEGKKEAEARAATERARWRPENVQSLRSTV